jgi:hypothetical protein
MEGKPYEMKYMDLYGNLCAHFIDCPDVISKFFETSNIIDMHNQLHQDLLQLEKKWLKKTLLSPGLLAFQLLQNAKHLGCPCQHFMPEEIDAPQKTIISDLSSPSMVESSFSDKPVAWSLQDANGKMPCFVKFDVKKDPSGHSSTKKRKFKRSLEQNQRQDVGYYCILCGESFSFCTNVDGRDCFKEHVQRVKRATRRTS